MTHDFFKLHRLYRLVEHDAPDNAEAIYSLKALFSDSPVPDEYLCFISQMTEAEILVNNAVYLRVWGAAGCAEMNEAYLIQHYMPRALAIGDNEEGEVIFYAPGKNGFGLYKVGFGNLDMADAQFIAPSLVALLIEGAGAENLLR
ncbi:SMI1/KNR4 family protein [Kosakonia sp. BK9b]